METPSYYAIIPADVRYADITPNAKLLYGEITCLSKKTGVCFASNEYFSKLYKVSHKTVSVWVSELVKNGFIKSELIYKKGTREVEKRHITISNYVEIDLDDKQEKIKIKNKQNDFVIPVGFVDMWKFWESYMEEQHKYIYQPIAKKTSFDRLMKLSNSDIYKAQKIVDVAIAGGYKGFFPLKEEEEKQYDQPVVDYWANERRKDEAKARGKDELMETLTITM